MDGKQPWDNFLETGSIIDYLDYKMTSKADQNSIQGATANAVHHRRVNNKRATGRGKRPTGNGFDAGQGYY